MIKSERFFYGWVIVGTGILVTALAYGIRYSFSVMFTSLLQYFQWSRDSTAAIFSFQFLAYGITAPIAGALVDRLGSRKTMSIGAVILASGAAISSFGNELWHYYLSLGLFTGTGLVLIGAVPFTRVVTNWFTNKRGLALSLLFFGTGCSHLLYPLFAFLIEELGWRQTFLVESAIAIVILLPCVILFVRSRPEEMGLVPDGIKTGVQMKAKQKVVETVLNESWVAVDWTLTKAIKTWRFWLLCLSAFSVWGIAEQLMFTHHIAFAEDVGYSKMYASSVLSMVGMMMAIGALMGFISDKIGREVTFTVSTFLLVLGIVAMMLITDASTPGLLYLYAILFGFGLGLGIPALAAAVTDVFQGRRAGATIGFVWFMFAVGGTIGPWLGGVIFEVSGSYLIAFILSAVMAVISCIALWIAAPRQIRLVAGKMRRDYLPSA
ncbi:MFS transporter [Chloroflexota bacterium]